MNVGFVLASYGPDEPAGMERSIAALIQGLEILGHQAIVIAAGPSRYRDDEHIERLQSLQLQIPLTDEALLSAVLASDGLVTELDFIASKRNLDIVCWVDALWGLGLLGRPRGRKSTVLMVHVIGHAQAHLQAALNHQPDSIIVPSQIVVAQARAQGQDSSNWKQVPNALLEYGEAPPKMAERIQLLRTGPIRAIARLGSEKGILPLLRAMPPKFGHQFDVVLAEAAFEAHLDSQTRLRFECEQVALTRSEIRLLPALPWRSVPDFLAEAAITIVPSLAESFGLVALESLSVGTPVIAFNVGNLPVLLGSGGGRLVPQHEGAEGLWRAALQLLLDEEMYRWHSLRGLLEAQKYDARTIATEWLAAVSA